MIYADTSALLKLIVTEDETPALRRWLADQTAQVVTNAIGVVELQRVAARVSPEAATAAHRLVQRIDRLSLTPHALAAAGTLPPPEMRTLDALHLASAVELSDLVALVTYDSRMRAAALDLGLPVVSPSDSLS